MKPLAATLLAFLIATGCSKATTPEPTSDVGTHDVSADDVPQRDTDGTTPTLDPACNPLGQEFDCLLPFPSDFFLTADGVELGEASPRDKSGEIVRAFDARSANGFSVHPSILFTLGDGLDPDSLVPESRAANSVEATSSTLLLDTETGEAVPHFSEVYLGGDADLQIGAIRPLVRLSEGRRYVVAVQGARHVDGSEAAAPRVFASLRDSGDEAPPQLVAHYETQIFGVLQQFGVERSELDLAWDFTTRTRDDLMGDMLSVRDGTLAWLETNTPTVTITEVLEGDDLGVNLQGATFRHIEGTFTAPLWTETDEPGAVLRGPLGAREIVGTRDVAFTITIPNSIANDAARRGPFIQYGHGFFGRREEVISAVQTQFGDDFGFVMGAVDWIGMAREDRDWVVGSLAADGAADAFAFAPRVHQGMANQLVFTHVVRTMLANEDALMVGTPTRPAYEPDQSYFLGISQGHILGGTFMAISPTIERAVLNVGGASFGMILTRSYAFLIYERLLAEWLDPIELLKFEAVATLPLEVIDPIAYAPLILSEPLPGAAAKQVLLQGGMGDAAVPNVSIELHARAIGIPMVTPSPTQVPFMDEVAAPAPSGLTFVDFGADPNTAREWRPVNRDTEVHDGVRNFGGAREQMNRFLQPGGQIEDTCNGPCVVP